MLRNKDLMLTEPGAVMRRLVHEFDRVYDDRAPRFFREWRPGEWAWLPELEMFERDRSLVVRLDLPGVTPNDVTVTVTEGGVAVEGERKRDVEQKKGEWFATERTYGNFYRLISLPNGVKPDEVEATFVAGVLELTAPLPEASAAPESRKVPIIVTREPKPAKTAA